MEKKDLITDLSNTKIDLSQASFEVRKKVQERAFELGWQWAIIGRSVKVDFPYMFFYEDKFITRSLSKTNFEGSDFKEIQIKDILVYTLKELPSDADDRAAEFELLAKTPHKTRVDELEAEKESLKAALTDLLHHCTITDGVDTEAFEKAKTTAQTLLNKKP